MIVGACVLELRLSNVSSLKQKRSQIKYLLARLRREFNVAVSETSHNDFWQSAQISMVAVSNNRTVVEDVLRKAVIWVEIN
ncbi:MAG TPA: DUF503 domain-containing protein, partial [Anaerolineales bacterium]|nr:DUF503 domain-containing protein [Anaerolineales bacterium]